MNRRSQLRFREIDKNIRVVIEMASIARHCTMMSTRRSKNTITIFNVLFIPPTLKSKKNKVFKIIVLYISLFSKKNVKLTVIFGYIFLILPKTDKVVESLNWSFFWNYFLYSVVDQLLIQLASPKEEDNNLFSSSFLFPVELIRRLKQA